ncbi:MAG: DUF559 domain-containing protein [Pyrinomonadaceae bacterium]
MTKSRINRRIVSNILVGSTARKPRIKADRQYWIAKIEGNIARDKTNNRMLKKQGFTVLRFWEQDIRKRLDTCLAKILANL